jgi:ribonuclease Z
VDSYGGRTTLQRVAHLLFKVVFPNGRAPIEINLLEIQPGVIFHDDKFTLTAVPVSHRGPDCYGFVFEEKPHRPFLAEKASELGVPFGPERGRLVQGETVVLADGRTIHPDDVLGIATPGTKYVHIGDVGQTESLVEVCREADALVIEATYLHEDAAMAEEFGHLTAVRAAQLAQTANVKTLILTHLSRRYFARDVRQQAQAIFPHTYIAHDFDHYQISRAGVVRLDKERAVRTPGSGGAEEQGG